MIQKYNPQIPLLATSPEQGILVQLVLTKMSVNSIDLPPEILAQITADNENIGVQTEILSQTQIGDNMIFEAKYQVGQDTVRSKEVLFLSTSRGRYKGSLYRNVSDL